MPALATGPGPDTGLYELLSALPSQLQMCVKSADDRSFLHTMFSARSLHTLVQIHEKLQHYEERCPAPVLDSAGALAQGVSAELQTKPLSADVTELLKLLSNPHVKSLLSVHDTVAQKSYDPELPPLPDDVDDDEDSVKIIRLVKSKEPLGATIKKDEKTRAITIARIMKGGAADRSGLIHVGDELKEVNGIPVEGKKPEDVIQILSQSEGAITFKVVPGPEVDGPANEHKMYVKALFDYDPEEDNTIPCKEAGMSFKRGDVLRIMSQEDATWWQAKVEGGANPRAGLVPSKHFQERRFALRQPISNTQPQKVSRNHEIGLLINAEYRKGVTGVKRLSSLKEMHEAIVTPVDMDDQRVLIRHALNGEVVRKPFDAGGSTDAPPGASSLRRSFRLSRRGKKTNKSMYECKKSEQYDTADVPTYEEVAPYCRANGAKHRLVVIVGPTGVGMNELKRKLLISDPQHFSITIPHTSRAKRNQENDGVEYHFISKHLFETDVQNNKFIEHGEYKGNYYGTSLDSVRSVLAKNKVCLLDVQPHCLRHLRTAEFKPFVVFVKPPSIERLRETRRNAKVISAKGDKDSSKSFTDEDFQEMINTAHLMENQYSHLFDLVIVNDELARAFGELKQALRKVETETHWVPVSWTHS